MPGPDLRRRSPEDRRDVQARYAMRRGEAALLSSIDQLRSSVDAGFREVAVDHQRIDDRLDRIETNLVNLAADFRIRIADGHAHDDE